MEPRAELRGLIEDALEGAGSVASPLVAALVDGPEPEDALRRALQLDDGHLAAASADLARAMHQGSYLGHLFGLVPTEPVDDPTVVDAEARRDILRARIEALAETTDLSTAIARVRTEAYVRIGLAELGGAPIEVVGAELSSLVEACTGAALASENLEHEVVVFAMGKLAGDELNFLSDVDLVFAHEDPDPEETGSAAHRRRTHLFARLRNVLRLLEGSGQWRPVFRLDLRLRPFGSRGPLSLSSTAMERYYERHGRGWERQVWLRARPMAGRIGLGERILERLAPFVYPRTLGSDVMREVAKVMRRARRDARLRPLGGGFDLKHDRGGIREVEFFVQALQLLHAGRDPSVRSPSTLATIDRLAAAGHLSDREHETLTDAYRWLRRVEHRLQLAEGQQTHSLPADEQGLARLGARLAATGHLPDPEALLAELSRVTRSVCAITATMDPTDPEVEPEVQATRHRREWAREVVLDPGAPASTRRRALDELGLADPHEASAVIEHLLRRRESPFAGSEPGRTGAEALLLACLDTADPDGALLRLVSFCSLRPAHYAAWRWLADPDHAEVVRRVADLFGASEPLSRGLIGFPNARGVADDGSLRLLARATEARLPEAGAIESGAQTRAADHTGEELDRAMLRFLCDQLVAIGLHDLSHRPDSLRIGSALSDVADAIVRCIATDALRAARASDTTDLGLTLGVFAVGKFGERAMDYGSDLDLLFVYDSTTEREQQASQAQATRAARSLRARLEGSTSADRLYAVDMRLRPSGQQGLLVTSLRGFASYHARAVPIWERIALCRLRPVAVVGPSSDLAARVDAIVERSVFDRPTTAEDVREAVRHLRARVEREIARETRMQWNAKSGRGGVFELELLVGALQLLHPTEGVRGARATLRALDELHAAAAVSAEDHRALSAAYRFLRRFLNRLRMRRGAQGTLDPDRFDVNSPRLSMLARRMGVADRDSLIETFDRHRTCVRATFERLL